MKGKISKTNWVPTDNRFVAFFDILGFKDLVMRNSHNDIYDKLNWISKTKKWLENLPADSGVQDKVGNGEIYTVSFSDSIVLFSKNDDAENFKFFLVAVRWLFAKVMENKTPIKGGLAHGLISLNKSEQIYFGQAIIDAYFIEEDVNYFGVVAHNSIDMYIDENKKNLDMEYVNEILFDCLTPLKSGKIEHKNVDWFRKLTAVETLGKDGLKNEEISNTIKSFRLLSSGSPRRYVDNTLDVLQKRRELLKI